MLMDGTRDFSIDAMQCRWQHLPGTARARDIAIHWLRVVAGDAAADSLHRDARNRPRLLHGDTSWSHSHARLLVAYTPRGRVGVDIDSRVRRTAPLRIARRYFAPEETAALAALDEALRHDAFLRLWCAKEAVLKAHGGGIAFGLHKAVFDVGGEGLRMLRCDPALGQVGDWSLHMLEPEAGFVAVLASTD